MSEFEVAGGAESAGAGATRAGGRVGGTGVTEVRVRAMRLGDGCPVAVRDTARVCDLAIDFTAPPEDIAAALRAILQEAIDTGRWVRRRAGPRA
ncbi:hypothetical protein [Streptomyces sp.]|uniref:hypothetical protein n=1 Tax=Streptomyces sp. TaxID=1931 RepID=UPI002F423499